MLHRAAVLCLATLACIGFSHAQDGTLDPSWDEDGRVITVIGDFNDVASGIAIQRDRKIVVVGQTSSAGRSAFFVARYLLNGALDPSFGTNGITVTNIGDGDARALDVAVQEDGRIVVAGVSTVSGNEVITVARYNDKTGDLDQTFNDDGIVQTPVGGGWSAAHSVAIHPSGAIIAAGYVQLGPDYVMALVQYDRFGELDPTFGSNGVVTTQFSIGNDVVNAIRIQDADRIIVAGSSRRTGSNSDVAIAMYKQSGVPNGAFAEEGKRRHPVVGSFNEYGNDIALQRDGKIVMVGSTNSLFHDVFLVRYLPDGSFDREFGSEGIVTTDVGTDVDFAEMSGVAIQSDDKIVVAGLRNSGTKLDIALIRYTSTGGIDQTFGDAGFVTTDFSGEDDAARAVAIQHDGKILVAGQSHNGTQNRIAIARYNNPSVAGPSSVYASQVASPKIVPNPFRTSTTLVFEHDLVEPSVSLINALGERVSCTTTYTSNQLHVAAPGLPTGIYVVHVVEPSGRRTVQTVAVQR